MLSRPDFQPPVSGEAAAFRPIVVAPTFNNAATLPGVIRALAEVTTGPESSTARLPILVVNDGSSDDTAAILSDWQDDDAGRLVQTHVVNRGKAAALQTGFAHAGARGFTHAITIDTDGQHETSDILPLLRLAEGLPGALVIGCRPFAVAGCPPASRIGRWVSNRVISMQCGLSIGDSQSGLRVYPLGVVRRLPTRAPRYAFETEIIVRAAWANVPVIEAPINCLYEIDGGRVSHFNKVSDTLSACAMHIRLLLRSLSPWPVPAIVERAGNGGGATLFQRGTHWFSPIRAWRAVRDDLLERRRFAAGLSLGVFIANLPLYGLQTVLSVILARHLRLQPLAVVAGSHLSTPPVGPVLVIVAIMLGHFVISGQLLKWDDLNPGEIGYFNLLQRVAAEWIVGGVIFGLVLAGVTFVLSRLMLHLIPAPPSGEPSR